ncbi:Signal recognition particle 14 kDa protein [Porphyridium purpureum]|uniref:Signal recognition particle 14 kDa protein n=1 Tax=Porphyridium purpureum TaxID=35688 RepID=A0A5J4YU34_PORPP|nr:Signal recognition particle 14 kDa protein [Porphyridium purpureum]|eukprot:POR4823..scf229_5
MRLEHDGFLHQLGKLYEASRDTHSVWVTLKRVEAAALEKSKPKGARAPADELAAASGQPQCLVRATNGKRKISCVVDAPQIARFQLELMTVMRANADGLKKKPKASKKAKLSLVEQ